MHALSLFLPITKVDAERREVVGTAVWETEDLAGETFDYASSKPEFEKLAKLTQKASGGKKVAPLRVMHQPDVAAGKVLEWGFDDTAKAITARAQVTDDATWQKVLDGTLCSFSIGGKYANRWSAGTQKRYTARPSELSLVDLGCVPATGIDILNAVGAFDLVKADGSTERVPYAQPVSAVAATDATPPTVLVTGSAPVSALAKSWGLDNVAQLTRLLSDLGYLVDSADGEAASEGDESAVPATLRDAMRQLGSALLAMAAEEVGEAVAEPSADNALMLAVGRLTAADALAKRGARNSRKDSARIQGTHDLSVELGAMCAADATKSVATAALSAGEGDTTMDQEQLTKALGDAMPKAITEAIASAGLTKATDLDALKKSLVETVDAALNKAAGQIDTLAKTVGEQGTALTKTNETLAGIDDRLKALEAAPAPAKGVVTTVSKTVDTGGDPNGGELSTDALAKLAPDQRALELMKRAHRNPTPLDMHAATRLPVAAA